MRLDLLQPFAMLPTAATSLLQDLRAGRVFDKPPTPYLIAPDGKRCELAADGEYAQSGMIAVVPLMGPLDLDGNWGTSLNDYARTVARLGQSPQIAHVVTHARTPGGTVTGTPEAADSLRSLRGVKPTTTIVTGMMASAGSWIGAASDRVVIAPSASAGSIGVITMYADVSRAWKDLGVDITVLRTPAGKARFTGVEPLTDEMKATLEDSLAKAYEDFKKAMSKNRGIPAGQVESRFGGGEMLDAKEALEAGLVDEIATFDEALSKIVAKHTRRAPASARAKLALAELDI